MPWPLSPPGDSYREVAEPLRAASASASPQPALHGTEAEVEKGGALSGRLHLLGAWHSARHLQASSNRAHRTALETEARGGKDACPRPGEPPMVWGHLRGFGGRPRRGSNPCFPTPQLYLLGQVTESLSLSVLICQMGPITASRTATRLWKRCDAVVSAHSHAGATATTP